MRAPRLPAPRYPHRAAADRLRWACRRAGRPSTGRPVSLRPPVLTTLEPRLPMSAALPAAALAAPASLAVDYVHGMAPGPLLAGDDVLAVFGFGDAAPRTLDDPRYLHVPLQPFGDAPCEVWRGGGRVLHGRDGDIAWSTDGALSFGAIEVDERAYAHADDPTGIVGAAAHAYSRMLEFVGASGTAHLLRVWNYLDAITTGHG